MGSGQSKFYKNANKQQYPFGPPPPHMYPGQYNPQPFVPPYGPMGYAPQMYPPQHMPGFVPPGAYGQGAHLPPPLLNWLPQDRRKSRKSRRRESERFVGGFAQEQPQAEAPRRARSESRRRDDQPVIPPVMPAMRMPEPNAPPVDPPARRSSTPFVPTFANEEDDRSRSRSQHGHSQHGHSQHGHGRPASRQSVHYSPPHSVNGDFAHVMQPLEPANPVVFGPTGQRPAAPLRNPLPPPPRDIYEMSPYKTLLEMPQTEALLTASFGPHLATVTTGAPAKVERKKSIGKGLLRAFSKREKKPEPKVHFVPFFVPQAEGQSAASSQAPVPAQYPTATAQRAADLIRSMSTQSRPGGPTMPPAAAAALTQNAVRQHNSAQQAQPARPAPVTVGAMGVASTSHSADAVFPPIPPMPSSPPAVRFDQDSPYAVFMNHSPHRVLFRNQVYPTAAHLFEAMKFVDAHPEIAEQIRACPDVLDLYHLTAQFHEATRPDWPYVHLSCMDEVLMLKFKQHPDLRMRLLATGDARIIYSDANDAFWGSGADENGQNGNLLGKALCRVREKLRNESS